MEQNEKTRKSLIDHYDRYPKMGIQDMLKFLYQSSFGCEHMLSDLNSVIDRIAEEYKYNNNTNTVDLIDPLDGDYSRVNLGYLKKGLSVETFGKLFLLSAREEYNCVKKLESKLIVAKELVYEKIISFPLNEFEKEIGKWKSKGYPPVHHSNEFRTIYKPSYRVLSNKYIPFLPLFAKIDEMLKNGSVVVAIDGRSGSGKTTLSNLLKVIYDCNVIHMDDFFLRPEQRTAERYAEVGGNVDRERFLEEVLIPLKRNEPIYYRRFDCSKYELCDPITIIPNKLTIIEGVYSMHTDFADYYDLSVFLDISPELQKERIKMRNTPKIAKQFFEKWIPLEETYFLGMNVKQRCNLSIQITNK